MVTYLKEKSLPKTKLINCTYRFNYECPDMYNKAEFIISILNSDDEKAKRDVDEICKLSSTDKQTDLNYNLFNNEVQLLYNYIHYYTHIYKL